MERPQLSTFKTDNTAPTLLVGQLPARAGSVCSDSTGCPDRQALASLYCSSSSLSWCSLSWCNQRLNKACGRDSVRSSSTAVPRRLMNSILRRSLAACRREGGG